MHLPCLWTPTPKPRNSSFPTLLLTTFSALSRKHFMIYFRATLKQSLPKGLIVSSAMAGIPHYTCTYILETFKFSSFIRPFSLQDIIFIGGILWLAHTYIPYINADHIKLPHPALYPVAQWTTWMLYGFAAGVAGFGLFVVGHECGHGAYATSRLACDVVGYIVHSL